jgi:hypothetical protein
MLKHRNSGFKAYIHSLELTWNKKYQNLIKTSNSSAIVDITDGELDCYVLQYCLNTVPKPLQNFYNIILGKELCSTKS